jgi:hypothetical protein
VSRYTASSRLEDALRTNEWDPTDTEHESVSEHGSRQDRRPALATHSRLLVQESEGCSTDGVVEVELHVDWSGTMPPLTGVRLPGQWSAPAP